MQYFVVQSLLDSAVWKIQIAGAWQFISGVGIDWFKPDLLLWKGKTVFYAHYFKKKIYSLYFIYS